MATEGHRGFGIRHARDGPYQRHQIQYQHAQQRPCGATQGHTGPQNDDHAEEKQRLLDAAEQVREMAARESENANWSGGKTERGDESGDEELAAEGEDASFEERAAAAWSIAVCLLGAGAERLEANKKRALARAIIIMAELIANDATAERADIDFEKLKKDMVADEEFVNKLAGGEEDKISDAKRTIEGLVDIFEMQILMEPLGMLIASLCEEARDNVLGESIINTNLDGPLSRLVRGVWLADMDMVRGSRELRSALAALPKAKLARFTIANHLMQRVYWKQWRREAKVRLLTVADECLRGVGLRYDKPAMMRLIDREDEDNEN